MRAGGALVRRLAGAVLLGWVGMAALGAARAGGSDAAGAGDAIETPAAAATSGPVSEADGGASAARQDATAAEDAAPAPIHLSDLKAGAESASWTGRLLSLVGLLAMVALGWLLSVNRRVVPWRVILWGVGLQLVFGVFIMKTAVGKGIFEVLNDAVARLLQFTADGSRFVFGPLMGEFSFALNVLPTIIFFSSLMTVLYHLGVMQWVVRGMAWVMQRTMGTSGSETLSAAANIFVGQTEAPLVVKPFVETMTRSELMAVMTGGFATVAGGVLASYVGMLSKTFPDIAGHLIAASVMSAPAALVLAKVMFPETERSATAGSLGIHVERIDANVIDAAARGAGEGLKLALNVGAMLLAFVALVAMLDYLLALPALWHNQSVWGAVQEALKAGGHTAPSGCAAPDGAAAYQACIDQARQAAGLAADRFVAWTPLTLERILGWVFLPIAWLIGVPAQDASVVAQLLGEKLVLNEFYAYAHLARLLNEGVALSHRSVVIVVYALCGFANFGSIAIQIGGIGGIAPGRRHDLARIGLRAMIGGTLAALMTATVAGILI